MAVPGIVKYSLIGGTWTATGSVDSGAYRGLTARSTPGGVELFATRNAGELVALLDTGGYAGALVGQPSVLASAATNTAFRGVAFAPAIDCLEPDAAAAALAAGMTLVLLHRAGSRSKWRCVQEGGGHCR
jgi:hypothetical protein